jgi:hypothetical protein
VRAEKAREPGILSETGIFNEMCLDTVANISDCALLRDLKGLGKSNQVLLQLVGTEGHVIGS